MQAEFFRTRILPIGSTTGSPKNYQEKDKRNGINMIFNVLLLGENLHSCNFSSFIQFIAGIELAVVSFLLEQLGVVVLAVKFSLMGNVIRGTNGTAPMGAFETSPVICSPIHSNLRDNSETSVLVICV